MEATVEVETAAEVMGVAVKAGDQAARVDNSDGYHH